MVLHAVVVDKTDAIDQTDNKLVARWIDLHGCDVVGSLLPVYHLALVHIPDADHFVEAARSHIVLTRWLDEERRAENIRVLQDLDRFIRIDVPDYYDAVGADREQVRRGRILGAPIYFKYILHVEAIPLLKWFRIQQRHLLRLSKCTDVRLVLALQCIIALHLPNPEDMVLTPSRHELTILPELDHPYCTLLIL